jgi:hypothetical protein
MKLQQVQSVNKKCQSLTKITKKVCSGSAAYVNLSSIRTISPYKINWVFNEYLADYAEKHMLALNMKKKKI